MSAAVAPDERMAVSIPVGGGACDGLADLVPTLEPPPGQGERAQNFPPRFNEVEIGRVRGLKHHFPARVGQHKQQDIHGPMGAQIIRDRIDPLRVPGQPSFNPFQEVHPVG